MAEPMPASELDAIRARVAKTSNTYASLRMVQPSQAAVDRSALLAEVERLNGVALAAELERDVRLTAEHVERFLKRERDEYEPRGECWNTVNDVLDAFRLHLHTGTPLTEPRPQEGPEALGVGPEPLTEAEELCAEVERLTAALVERGRDADCARIDYELAKTRADKAEAALAELQGQNAMTEANFDAYVDDAALQENRLRAALEEVAFRSVQRDLADLARTALDLRPSITEEGER